MKLGTGMLAIIIGSIIFNILIIGIVSYCFTKSIFTSIFICVISSICIFVKGFLFGDLI